MICTVRSAIAACRPWRTTLACGLLGVILGLAGPANAFMIVESANGIDGLPTRPSDYPSPEIAVLGLNFVEDSSACFTFGCGDLYDSFQFVVPVGLQVSTEFEITSANTAVAFGSAVVVFGNDGVTVLDPDTDPRFPNIGLLFADALVGLNSNSLNVPIQSAVVLGPGLYDVVIINGGQARSKVSFTATVPEAGSLVLFAATLAFSSIRRAARIKGR